MVDVPGGPAPPGDDDGGLWGGGVPLDAMRGVRPTVVVTVPVLTLLGGDQPADLAGYGPIDPDTARRLAADAPSFLRILTHPETGAVLSVGRERYAVPARLRAWLRVRDETCRFPGCARRAEACDVDHVTRWADHGSTSHDNLVHLCRAHHRIKHTTRWQATTLRGNGVLEWTSPTGRTYTTDPAVWAHGATGPDVTGPGDPVARREATTPSVRTGDAPSATIPRAREAALDDAPPF